MNTDLTKELLDAQYPLPDGYNWNRYSGACGWSIEDEVHHEPVAWVVIFGVDKLCVYFGPVGTVSPYEDVLIDTEEDGIRLMYTRCLLGMV